MIRIPSLQDAASSLGLKHNELDRLIEQLGRNPSYEEIAVTGALWSEHCSYKSSRVHLGRFHTEEAWVWQGPGENAGVVGIDDKWGIAFKMESHNHPTYIEPYQGAATGVGGILRDVFCMGAWPVASLNCLRFGYGTWNEHCLKRAVEGIADYGNSVGVPTVSGDLAFHPRYSKNVLVNAFNAGLITKDAIFKGVLTDSSPVPTLDAKTLSSIEVGKKLDAASQKILFPEGENLLCYFGQATGRDGVHGATMSSSEFSSGAASLKPTVQVGDPFAERKLLEATRALIASGKAIGLQDMGAAGLTSSSVEMAGRSGCGVVLNLNQVPQRAANMQAFELLLSESQERMLAAVEPRHLKEVMSILTPYDVEIAIVGSVNHTGKFVCVFDNEICVSMPVEVLTDKAPKYNWPKANEEEYSAYLSKVTESKAEFFPVFSCSSQELFGKKLGGALESNLSDLKTLLSHPSLGNRGPVFHHYCASVQGNTVAGAGALQDASAAVTRHPEMAPAGVAYGAGCEERWVELHPFQGSQHSTLKVARKLIATGSRPLAMTDCLNFGSPLQPVVMKQLSDSVDGITRIAKTLKIPVVSGNVSLNNQTDGVPIPPTPMIGMVGKVDDVSKIRKTVLPASERKETISLFWINHKQLAENLRAHQAPTHGLVDWLMSQGKSPAHFALPEVDLESEAVLWDALLSSEFPKATLGSPAGNGGVFARVLKLAFQNSAEVSWCPEALSLNCGTLFTEFQAGFVFGFAQSQKEAFAAYLKSSKGSELSAIALADLSFSQQPTKDTGSLETKSSEDLKQSWLQSLSKVFPLSPVSDSLYSQTNSKG